MLDEVQAKEKRIDHFFTGIKVASDSAQMQLLNNISDLFSNKAYKKVIDMVLREAYLGLYPQQSRYTTRDWKRILKSVK